MSGIPDGPDHAKNAWSTRREARLAQVHGAFLLRKSLTPSILTFSFKGEMRSGERDGEVV
jgi:hypothetical protein